MKKYFLLILTIAILAFFAAEIAGAAVANPPPGAQKRKIIPPQAIYPATPIDVVNEIDQPPSRIVTRGESPSPSPTPAAAAAVSETTEEPIKTPKKHAQGVAILLVLLIAAIALGSGGIFIFNKMRAAKERDF